MVVTVRLAAISAHDNTMTFSAAVQSGTGGVEVDFDALQAAADNLAAMANRQPGLTGLFNGFRAARRGSYVDIDREKVKAVVVSLKDVFDALQTYLGSYYLGYFNRFGRTWQVNVQADDAYRTDPEAVRQLKIRNADVARNTILRTHPEKDRSDCGDVVIGRQSDREIQRYVRCRHHGGRLPHLSITYPCE